MVSLHHSEVTTLLPRIFSSKARPCSIRTVPRQTMAAGKKETARPCPSLLFGAPKAPVPNDSGIPHGSGSFWKRCHFRRTRGNLPAIPALGQSRRRSENSKPQRRHARSRCGASLFLACFQCTFPKQRSARRLGCSFPRRWCD